MTESYPVIITASDPQWTNGIGMLYEPFNGHETYYVYSVLYIAASANIPHGRATTHSPRHKYPRHVSTGYY